MNDVAAQCMSEHDATKLTEKIRITAHNYADARQKLQTYVAEAKSGNAHVALGYASWTAYLAEVLGEEPMRLARGERQEMVQMLSAEGMSTRAIAPIVGASQMQVVRDVKAGETNVSPAPLTENGGVITNDTPDSPVAITGVDGKSYARPATQPEPSRAPTPKRRPLTDQSNEAGWELARAVEKIERIITDDRLPANRDVVAGHLKQHLINSIDKLTILLNTL